MENNVMEKDTQAFTSRSNFIVEIQTKQKVLMRNVPKQMAELIFCMKQFFFSFRPYSKISRQLMQHLKCKETFCSRVANKQQRKNTEKSSQILPEYEIKLRYFFPITQGKYQYCWSTKNLYPICQPMHFCMFLLTFGVLVATACGTAAWPA